MFVKVPVHDHCLSLFILRNRLIFYSVTHNNFNLIKFQNKRPIQPLSWLACKVHNLIFNQKWGTMFWNFSKNIILRSLINYIYPNIKWIRMTLCKIYPKQFEFLLVPITCIIATWCVNTYVQVIWNPYIVYKFIWIFLLKYSNDTKILKIICVSNNIEKFCKTNSKIVLWV